jgi:hypothetical protein
LLPLLRHLLVAGLLLLRVIALALRRLLNKVLYRYLIIVYTK